MTARSRHSEQSWQMITGSYRWNWLSVPQKAQEHLNKAFQYSTSSGSERSPQARSKGYFLLGDGISSHYLQEKRCPQWVTSGAKNQVFSETARGTVSYYNAMSLCLSQTSDHPDRLSTANTQPSAWPFWWGTFLLAMPTPAICSSLSIYLFLCYLWVKLLSGS